jgi:hypothetical protein
MPRAEKVGVIWAVLARRLCVPPIFARLMGMTTGWSNEDGRNAVRRTLAGTGGTGRGVFLVVGAVFLALGLYSGYVFIDVVSGLVLAGSVWSIAAAARSRRAARRIGR